MVAFPTIPSFPISDVASWREFMRPVVEPWIRQGWVGIVDPLSKNITRDAKTGAVTGVTVEPIWVGWSRIQPLRTNVTVKKAVDSTTQRTVQFWIDFPSDQTIPDVKAGYEIVVVDGGNDPYLTKYKYVVSGSLNSSSAWQRTIDTFVDLESRPDYDTSEWPQKPVNV